MYKKTKQVPTKGDNDSETNTTQVGLRVIVRQVFNQLLDLHNPTTSTIVVDVGRRITLWSSACSPPFCAGGRGRRITFRRGEDYLIMGHVDRRTGLLVLDERSVVEQWKTRWPQRLQVCVVHWRYIFLLDIIVTLLLRRMGTKLNAVLRATFFWLSSIAISCRTCDSELFGSTPARCTAE